MSCSSTNGAIAFQEWGCDVWAAIHDDTSTTWLTGSSVCLEVSGSTGAVTLPSTGNYTVVLDPTLDAVGNLTLSLTLNP